MFQLRLFSYHGYPKALALGVTALFVLVPTQLGYVYYQGRKGFGRFTMKGVMPYTQRLSFRKYLGYSLVLFIWAGMAFTLTEPVSQYLLSNWFHWLPEWFLLAEDYTSFGQPVLLVTFFSTLFVTGLLAPIAEEVYFRGYLLPRMNGQGRYAVLLHTVLFAIYHFWSPWQFVARTLALLPMVYVVRKERNITLAIIVHCLINIVGDALFLLTLLLK